MRIVLFGGGGFIGTNLAVRFLAQGHSVRVFEHPKAVCRIPEGLPGKLEWVAGNFTEPEAVKGALEGADAVFHLVSTTLPGTSNEDMTRDVGENLVGSIRLMEAALEKKAGRIVFLSSGGTVYGKPVRVPLDEGHPTDPICSYGITKLAIEKYLALLGLLKGLDYVTLRLANPYGPHQNPAAAQGAATVFLNRAMRGEPIEIWGDGEVVRDYIYIEDAVAAMEAALHYRGEERVFNVGSGRGTSLNELVEHIRRIVGRPVEVRHTPSRKIDVPSNVLDIGRAERLLDWTPRVAMETGLARTMEYLDALR